VLLPRRISTARKENYAPLCSVDAYDNGDHLHQSLYPDWFGDMVLKPGWVYAGYTHPFLLEEQ
jgi:hypothetical protein